MRRMLLGFMIVMLLAPAAHAGVAILGSLSDFDDTDFRFNLGGGFGFALGKLGAFVEGKAVLGDNNEFVATFGLQF